MKGMSKGVGPNRLGTPKGVGKMMKKAPMKIMKKSPMEIGMDKKKMK